MTEHYLKPKSRCYCGHLGDGPDSHHGGINGHGRCLVSGCGCIQFTWEKWTDEYQAIVTAEVKAEKGVNQ